MNHLKTIAITALAILLFGTITHAQKKIVKDPKTVLDFYLLLPEDALAPLPEIKNRQSLIQVKDLANGYLKLEALGTAAASGWEGWGEVALFRKTSGGYVVGVVDGSNATMHFSGIEFYEYAKGRWRKVTEEIFPDVSSETILKRYKSKVPNDTEYNSQNPPFTYFELPRKGTTVKMFADAEDEGSLFEFNWNGEKFGLKK